MQHISVQDTHCPWLWTEVLSFLLFSLAFGHPASLFPGRQQYVVSVAVAIPLISSSRPRNKVLNEQHWCFRKQFLIVGVGWLSYCGSQPLLSLGSSLSNDSPVLQLDPRERFPWLGEGTTKVFQNGVSDMFKLWRTFFSPLFTAFVDILWTLFLESQIRERCILNTCTIRQTSWRLILLDSVMYTMSIIKYFKSFVTLMNYT